MKPELFESSYLFAALEAQRKACIDKDCNDCPLKDDFDEDTCKVDIMLELWRRLDNATAKQVHAHWESRNGVMRCSNCREEIPHVFVGGCTVDNIYPEIEYIDPTDICPSCGAIMDENN